MPESDRSRHLVAGVAALLLALTGCRAADEQSATETDASSAEPVSAMPTASEVPRVSEVPTSAATIMRPPCDPGGGFPGARNGCPDSDPETAWLKRHRDGRLLLEPFRTLGNDAAGKAYAHEHGLEFPFPNDYFDAPTGRPYALELDPKSVCTGIILVGYQEPLADHVVDCSDLIDVTARMRVPAAVWRDGTSVVQVSELYRP